MPILHIYGPASSVEFSSQEAALRTSPMEYAARLVAHEAELSLLDPGFEDDITPACFGPEPGMPEASIGIAVDSTGDRAVVTFAAGSTGLLASVKATSIGQASATRVVRVPEQTPVVPLLRGGLDIRGAAAHSTPRFQLGGLILRLTHAEMADWLAELTEPKGAL